MKSLQKKPLITINGFEPENCPEGVSSKDFQYFLEVTIQNNISDMKKFLSSSNFNPNIVIDNMHFLTLLLAESKGEIAEAVCKYGADPDWEWIQPNGMPCSLLGLYVHKENFDAVKTLIKCGADINKATQSQTPLMLSAFAGNIEITELLIKSGASIDIKDHQGATAIDYARSKSNARCIELIEAQERTLAALGKKESGLVEVINLAELIGQSAAKEQLDKILAVAEVNEVRKKQGLRVPSISFHAMFLGAPGTGKTTFARYFASQIKRIGILKSGHLVEVSRSDLIGGYSGQTAMKTADVFKKATDGILFIDEAYSLKTKDDDSYGQECIDTLLKLMEDHRDEVIVILAGYNKEMNEFVQANSGLKSRIPNNIEFTDYNDSELGILLDGVFSKSGMKISAAARTFALNKILQKKKEKNFANAREVRNIFEQSLARQAVRLQKNEMRLSKDDLNSIILSDVDPEIEVGVDVPKVQKNQAATDELNKLVGLENVKEELINISDYVKISKRRNPNLSLKDISLHMVFSGNPGTGKTTVARFMARIFFEIGILPTDNLVEADRSDLVAEFMGQTATKTREIFEKALGGVLFIDEAYTLSKAKVDQDPYGREAIDTLLKLMEDHRGKIVLIMAGYSQEMAEFLKTNPGLESRFSKTIEFQDYSKEQLGTILDSLLKNDSLKMNAEAHAAFLKEIDCNRKDSTNFANAREVRKLYEHMLLAQASRLSKLSSSSETELFEIKVEDVTGAVSKHKAA